MKAGAHEITLRTPDGKVARVWISSHVELVRRTEYREGEEPVTIWSNEKETQPQEG